MVGSMDLRVRAAMGYVVIAVVGTSVVSGSGEATCVSASDITCGEDFRSLLHVRSFRTHSQLGDALNTCQANCRASGFCCDRDSGCASPSCFIGCELASISSGLAECKSFCQQARGTCKAFPPTVAGCVRQASTCTVCPVCQAEGVGNCEPSGGCEHACEQHFHQPWLFSTLQKEDEGLKRCPQYGNESKMEYLSDGIFTFWWQTGFDTLHVGQKAARVFAEVRADVLARGMPDPPNPGKGYYFNVYLHRGIHDAFPQWWGAGVGTNQHDLPFMALGTGVDHEVWRHEAFHVFQYSTKGVPYSGDTMWAIEATASFYALTKDSLERRAFGDNLVLSNLPHVALWHSFSNGPAEEQNIWDYGMRQYAMKSMLWWITTSRNGMAPWVDANLIYAALTHKTPYPGGLQACLYDHDPRGFRQGFLDWAVHTTNDHDYLTADQRHYAEWNMGHSNCPSCRHPFAAHSERRIDAFYTLRPAAALKPRGWAYNVILLSDTAPGNYTFRLIGNANGSEGASAYFVASALVAGGASADIVNFRMVSGLEGFANVPRQPSGGTIKLIIAATPAHFTGNQNYGYSIDVDFAESTAPSQPPTPAPSPTATPAPSPSTACTCGCHGANYAVDDRHDPPDCWIPDYGYDEPCCPAPEPTTTAPPPTATPAPSPSTACTCECRGAYYAVDDRHDPPDCWIPDYGYDKPCCPALEPTTTAPPPTATPAPSPSTA